MRTSFPSLPLTWGCHLQVRSVLAVPPGFDGFLRSCAAGLFHPAADHGVHCVSASCSLGCLGRRLDCSSLLPPHLSSAFPLSRSVRPERTNLGPPSEGFPSNEAVPGLTLLRLWKRLQAVLPRALFFRSFLSLARLVLPLFQLPSPPGSSPVERDHRGGRALGRPLSSLLPQLLRFSIAGSPLPPCPPCLAFALPLGPGLLDLRVLIRVGVRREGACFQVPPSDPPMGFHSLRRS